MSMQTRGFCFYWVKGWGPRVSGAHFLFINLKHKSRNLKPGKRKKSVQMVTYQNQPRSLKQRSLSGRWPGSLSSPVAGTVFIGDSHA